MPERADGLGMEMDEDEPKDAPQDKHQRRHESMMPSQKGRPAYLSKKPDMIEINWM
eukprot:CAMPEP_0197700624 /NCGR_PEP_ID=MMETSP1338-20131121/122207_1 /TAXON_ID=43686 ORGANISM="Pelagodinium beii, Strain RCC1491" /NCGR_SAMPLE_ID=MMETSP1338 /ASSEMBLY_ACC=CAM_ASM_000754 /LENGTH=55 /DNA_ID=CAMNT_0043284259 /DNA_START=8 /DNA_END=172 /DNA_ORIENTATION=+